MSRAKKYNWYELKKEWLTGKYKNMEEMRRAKKIPPSTFRKNAAKGKWADTLVKVEERAEELFEEKAAKIISTRQIEILEKQLKYSQILIGMGFGNLKGKTKLSKESDALRAIFSGMEAQLRTLEGFRRAAATEDVVPPGSPTDINVTVNNLQVNAAQGMTNEQIQYRLQQLVEEKKRLASGGHDKI